MATEKNLKKLTIHKLKKKTYNALAEKPVDELVMLTDVGGQVAEITEASADYVGEIVQYVGETNDTYTNGYFYKCVSDGAETPTYSWAAVQVQEGGGGASLPDQTDNAGKFLMTDGTDVSWGEALVNNNAEYQTALSIGKSAVASSGVYNLALGYQARAGVDGNTNTTYNLAIGALAAAGAYVQASYSASVAIGHKAIVRANGASLISASKVYRYNDTDNTFAVANNNGTFTIMSDDGTIPTDRYTTTPTDAGTYVPKLTIAEDGTATREWGTESGGAGGDYLPLSGGTLTGGIAFTASGSGASATPAISDQYGNVLVRVGSYGSLVLGWSSQHITLLSSMRPLHSNITLGDSSSMFSGVYTQTISSSNYANRLVVPAVGGTLARIEDINNIVEVLPTADNGYTTVKNFGNNYIEATGVYEVGSVEANAEMVDVIAFPEGVQFEEGQMYWANAHATTEDANGNTVVANVISRGSSDITIVYKNLGSTAVENLTICWEVRGVVAPK